VRRPPRKAAAQELTSQLRERMKRDLVAVGVCGSAATGEDRAHSDIDMLCVVRRPRRDLGIRIYRGYLVTVLQLTAKEAAEEVLGSRAELGETLGGWRSMRPLYDPTGLLTRLAADALHPHASQFRKAARRALLETFEDYGKLLNAIDARDRPEMREMAIWFTGAAHLVVLDLAREVLPTGRRAFVEVHRFGKLGEAILALRYKNLSIPETEHLAKYVWRELLRRAKVQGIVLQGIG